MSKQRVWALVFFLLASLPFVLAEGADWYAVPIHYSWDLSMSGSCANETQCLVDILGNSTYDANLMRWYELEESRNKPKCINNTQYLLDYYCDRGNWTTRTKLVALSLLKYAETASPENFTLYCDYYNKTLNKFHYPVLQGAVADEFIGDYCSIAAGKLIPCVNSVCVLKTPSTTSSLQENIAFGTSLNIPVDSDAKSFMKALGKSPALCRGKGAGNVFVKCDINDAVWFNSAINSTIWLSSGALSPPTTSTAEKISTPMLSMGAYVRDFLNNPQNPGKNFVYFPKTRLFNHLYVAQNGPRAVFGFMEANLRPEYTLLPENESEPVPLDYIGVRYSNIDLGQDPCLNLIKLYDSKAFCENQTGTGFNVIARHRCEPGYEDYCKGASPIVSVWSALTGKLRP